MTQTVDDPLALAREAVSRKSWREAFAAYVGIDETSLSAVDLERYAEAAWWSGKLVDAVRLRERAYVAYAGEGQNVPAAQVALTLAWDEANRGAFAVSQGWFATAERQLEGEEESAVHGRVALTQATQAMFAEGNYPRAIECLERAYDLGGRFGDRDTQMLALVAKGRALMKMGEIDKGLQLIDEGTAAAVSGQLEAYSTTLVYCMTITACQDVGDVRRAAEWTEAANRWCDRLDVTGFPGACRIHRAELMRLRGDLEAAEKVATAACAEVQDFERYITASGYYEIGEIRRRLGDFAAAEEAYGRANELGADPQPGVALLNLAELKLDAAVAGITRALAEVDEPLKRIRLLPAQVEIAVAARDLKTARAAIAELEQLVDSYKVGSRRAPAFDATVHVAAGRIALAEGDTDEAIGRLRHARDQWREVGAPFETAQARVLLGLAFRRSGDEHAAIAELDAAHAAFERIGARADAERAAELLGRQQKRRTFLFTDIVGSTRLLETLGNEKWKKLLARHDELLEEQIASSGGEVVQQTGDGFFAAFASPKAALEAAVAIQRTLAAEIVAPDVRIGAHTGEAFETDGAANPYGGEAVHLAARIGAAAGAGEILVSAETLVDAGTGFRSSSPRSEAFKGFEKPVEVISVDWR